MSHQEILRCSQEAANEKKMSVNVLPGETVAAHFSSLLLHDFIVLSLGFPVFSCMQEFPAQTYGFIYAFFRLEDTVDIHSPLGHPALVLAKLNTLPPPPNRQSPIFTLGEPFAVLP